MINQPVITAWALDLPSGEDLKGDEGFEHLCFKDFSPHKWYWPQFAQKVKQLTGGVVHCASFSDSSSDALRNAADPKDFKRQTTVRLYHCIRRMMETTGKQKNQNSKNIGIAKILGYSFFTSDARMNPFNFKANLEHQTAAPIGKWFNCQGPQLVFKEGDNCDLAAICFLSSMIEDFSGPMIVAGISEPHPLLTCMEVISEGENLKQAGVNGTTMNLRFSEGAAAVLLESPSSAQKSKRRPLARIEASFQSMRCFDYASSRGIEKHLETCMETLANKAAGDIDMVFACFRRNSLVVDLEKKAANRIFPRAELVSSVEVLGDLGPISGLVDLGRALSVNKNENHNGSAKKIGRVLIQKISRAGHYAGVVINVLGNHEKNEPTM
nr:hypothetical protein [uncultured Desulfobacter sp.]